VAGQDPTFADVLRARQSIAGQLGRTPLHRYPGLDELVGTSTWVKHENHHAVGAFKVRGGVHLATTLTAAERRAGLYTASTGNHGQSIAYAAKVTGARATIAVPEGANPAKVAAMRALGAEVVFRGVDYDEAREWVERLAREKGGRFIGPADPELIAGVATVTLEIFEDLPEADTLFVPVGAGSGACGALLAARALRPETRVIGVQAEAAPAMYRAWKGEPLGDARAGTAAEGLATRVPFENTQRAMRHPELGLDDFLLVSDAEMEDAIRLLLRHTRNVAEHAGAAALAGALRVREQLAGRRVVLILSGGNLSEESLRRIVSEGRLDMGARTDTLSRHEEASSGVK
jgi:threonine dehydratase